MSVKFEKETTKTVQEAAAKVAEGGPLPGTSGKHPLAAAVGTALTGGKEMAGTKGYLAVRVPPHATSVDKAGAHAGGDPQLTTCKHDYRPTSSRSRSTPCGPRCSPPERSLVSRS
jgi:hypothetical protein